MASGERFKVLKRCQCDEPIPREVEPKHWAACHQIPNYDSSPPSNAQLAHKRLAQQEVVS
jgi:hypothetical protein